MSSLCRISIGICHLISFFGLFVNWLVIFYRKKKKEALVYCLGKLLLAVWPVIISSVNDVKNMIYPQRAVTRISSLTFSSIKQTIDWVSILFFSVPYTDIYPSSLTNYKMCCHRISIDWSMTISVVVFFDMFFIENEIIWIEQRNKKNNSRELH